MNYIRHTRAVHQQLSRQSAATPHHISLYWALFFQWNAAHFSAGINLDHQATMQAAHIGNERTYRAALRDLEAWDLLSYQPSTSRHQPSRCFLTNVSEAELPEVTPLTEGESAPDKITHTTSRIASGKPRLSGANVAPVATPSEAEVPPVLLIENKTGGSTKPLPQNSGGGPKKKEGQSFADEELLEGKVEPNLIPLANGASEAPRTPRTKQSAKPNAGRRPQRPEVPFAESELARYDDFAAAFADTDYVLTDLRYYYARISAWRQKGEPPRRRDWHATAIQFFLNDAHDNRLKLAPGVQQYHPSTPQPDAGTCFARTGYRSKYDT